jgi:nicotinamidase-related amidase
MSGNGHAAPNAHQAADGSGAAPLDRIDLDLRQSFRLPGGMPEIYVEQTRTALVIIDMQYLDAHRDGEFGRRARRQGIEERTEWYFSRVEQLVVPTIAKLLEAARGLRLDVVYTRIAALTSDGRDLGWRYRHWGMTAGVEEKDSEILPEIAPAEGEIVINKTTTSAFMGSHIDRILRNLGAETLIVCGVITSGCVESTVRDAADAGYRVVLVEDACAALSEQSHRNAINAMHPIFATVTSSELLLEQLAGLSPERRVEIPSIFA